jgi:hypothetical protein
MMSINSTSAPSSEKLVLMSSRSPRASSRVRIAILAAGLAGPAGMARAAEREVASVRVAAALLDETLQSLLPTTVALPRALGDDAKKTFFLDELRYCGPGDKGSGRFRAVGRLGAGKERKSPLLVGDEACSKNLAEVADRARPALAEEELLVELEASWKGWELSLSVVRGLVAVKARRTRAMSGPAKPVEIITIRTADLRIDTGPGAPILLHAKPAFLPGAVEVAVALADSTPAKAPTSDLKAREGLLSGRTNIAAEIPAAFANQVLRRLTASQPLVIPMNREEIELADVTLTGQGRGEKARLTLAGNATPRSLRETMRWKLLADGDPLRVSSLGATAQLADCTGLGTMAAIGCNVRNGARSAAAEGFAQAFNQRYQTQLVHELVSPLDLRFTIAGQRILLRGDLVRASCSARGLLLVGQLSGK